MEEKERKKSGVSRREFITGTIGGVVVGAVVGAATGSLGFPKTITQTTTTTETQTQTQVQTVVAQPWLPAKWDYSADLVILGTGFAAQSAAIQANDKGASVLMLEKAQQKYQGGNSRVSGQGMWTPTSKIFNDAFNYLKSMTAGTGYPVPDEYLTFYVQGSSQNVDWFTQHGATMAPDRAPGTWTPFYPIFPGASGIASEPSSYSVSFGKYTGAGRDWYFLEDIILTRPGIKKMYETPAKKLIQNAATKEILGVVATSNGADINVKANKAVVVCTGGYEFNQQMIRDYMHIQDFATTGSPYNTGDGIKMGIEVGADLINMGVYAAPWGMKVRTPDYMGPISFGSPTKGGIIWVGNDWKRYKDEFWSLGKSYGPASQFPFLAAGWAPTYCGSYLENGVFRREKTPLPIHAIFDETARLAGPVLSGGTMGFAASVEGFTPSQDNSVEISKGYIAKANTFTDLAATLGKDQLGNPCDPAVLQATINNWNAMCAAGKDTDYGRTTNLTPVQNPPFYSALIVPGTLNTQGGLLRDINSRVLDKTGKPIPRLYAAGEIGDRVWANLYECMKNVGAGCLACGRVAGTNAAAETPWT